MGLSVSEQLPVLHWKGESLSAKLGGGGGTIESSTQLSSPSYSGSWGKLGRAHSDGGIGEGEEGINSGGGGSG